MQIDDYKLKYALKNKVITEEEKEKLKALEEEKKIENEKYRENIIETHKKKQKIKKTIKKLYISEDFKEIYAKYGEQIAYTYDTYVDIFNTQIRDINYEKQKLMEYKSFMQFNEHFNFYPGILIPDQIQLIFRSEAKKRVPLGYFLII